MEVGRYLFGRMRKGRPVEMLLDLGLKGFSSKCFVGVPHFSLEFSMLSYWRGSIWLRKYRKGNVCLSSRTGSSHHDHPLGLHVNFVMRERDMYLKDTWTVKHHIKFP